MILKEPQCLDQLQRVEVSTEGHGPAKRLKISLESHDEHLGWYTAASLSIPLHAVPLLQQALDGMSACEPNESFSPGTIIPFPGLTAESAAQTAD